MCYASIEDLTCLYKDIKCLSLAQIDGLTEEEKNMPLGAGTIPRDRVECALEMACAMLNQYLSCCFDICKLKELCESGKEFTALKFWQMNLARYYLYDNIKQDHESHRRFEQVLKDIEKFCNDECCSMIMATDGTKCEKICKVEICVAECPPSCIPDDICCGCNQQKCCCGPKQDRKW